MMRAAWVMLLLGACSLGTPVDTGRGNIWALDAAAVDKQTKRYGAVVVNAPSAGAELDTYRVALREAGGAIDYYAGTRWVDFLPVSTQAALVESLQDSGLFANVNADTVDSNASLILQVELLQFHAHYQAQSAAPSIEVALRVGLSQRSNGASLRQFTVRSSQRASMDGSAAISEAFRQAFADAQAQMVSKLAAR